MITIAALCLDIIGASLSEPHIVVLSRMSVQLVSVTSGVHLTYDRISKCKIVMLRRPPACLGQHAYKSPARQHRVESESLLRFTVYASATNYVATTDLQISAGGRDSLGNMGYSSQVQCSLIPSPTLCFWLLAVRTSLAVGQATKSWAWDSERGTTNLKLQLQDRQ